LKAGKQDPAGVGRMIAGRFPELAACVDSAATDSKLNKSLRWAVKNQLSVMTPQLYVAGVKLCDEDSDLGMDYMLHHMLQKHAAGQLSATSKTAAPGAPGLVPGSAAPASGKAGKAAPKREPAKPAADKPAAPPAAEPDKGAAKPTEPADKPVEPAKTPAGPDKELPSVKDPEPPEGQEAGAP
jgi:hypothetical protein